jgi:hypothetical protein
MAHDPANGPLALSGIGVGQPHEAEYDAVYAAVTATDRGRWFLSEFANRNRHADTGSLVAALARIEAAVHADARSNEAVPTPDLAAAAEKIQDIAFGLRERGADAALCNALDAAAREICAASANGADGPAPVHCAAPANADETEPAGEASIAATDQADHPDHNDGAAAEVEFALQDPEKFAAAAAALAAALGLLGDQAEEEPPCAVSAERKNSAAVIPPQDYFGIAAPLPPEPAASAPRWYIESPDFVFRQTRPAEDRPPVASGEARAQHALLPGPKLLPNPEDDPAELFEARPTVAVVPHAEATRGVVSAPSVSRAPTAVTQTPAPRVPVTPPARAVVRAAPINPLAALHALTEDELLALFG